MNDASEYNAIAPADFKARFGAFPAQYEDRLIWIGRLEGWQAARRTTPDREAIIEECAKVCHKIADRAAKWHGDEYSSGGVSAGFECRNAIRALKTVPTTSPRDTLVEEIAEMVDHMGEGRRLEEYVGAIREMKSGDKGGA